MTAYYNENDPKAAAWLRELISADVIVRGEVDERDIRDVTAADLVGFTQCHFFAGIGGWSYALRLAGWPDEREVWTGSCPCQPFSSAGRGGGVDDARHLWPVFYRLIAHARPAVCIGEQVGSPAGLQWLGAVHADLETSGYAFGAADLPAASVGAPHIRQRLFWVAHPDEQHPRQRLFVRAGESQFNLSEIERCREVGFPLGDAGRPGLSQRIGNGGLQREALESLARETPLSASDSVDVADTDSGPGGQRRPDSGGRDHRGDEEPGGGSGGGELFGELGHPGGDGARQHAGELSGDEGQHEERPQERDHPSVAAGSTGHLADADGGDPSTERLQRSGQHGQLEEDRRVNFWSDCDWLPCRDGKSRPVEPGTFPLAHGVLGRVGLLRGYGNAIVPQVAAQFILAYLDTFRD